MIWFFAWPFQVVILKLVVPIGFVAFHLCIIILLDISDTATFQHFPLDTEIWNSSVMTFLNFGQFRSLPGKVSSRHIVFVEHFSSLDS